MQEGPRFQVSSSITGYGDRGSGKKESNLVVICAPYKLTAVYYYCQEAHY